MKNKTPLYVTGCMIMVFIILAVFYLSAEKAKAITVTEDFDSYSTGQLSGKGNWVSVSGTQSELGVVATNAFSAPNAVAPNGIGTVLTRSIVATSSPTKVNIDWFIYKPNSGESLRLSAIDTTGGQIASVVVDSNENIELAMKSGFVEVGSTISVNTWTEFNLNIESISGVLNYELRKNGTLIHTSTTTDAGNDDFMAIQIAKVGNLDTGNRIDSITVLTDSDVNPVSGITNINEPIDQLVYAFNPIPVDIDYNQLDTYDYMVFDLRNTTLGQNVFLPPANLPAVTNTGLNYSSTFSLGSQGLYTLRARLYDSVNNLYTDWSSTIEFGLGATSTISIPDQGFASSTFATSTAIDSGNLLSYIDVPQLLSTKAPFGYFFQAYSIVSNSISNPESATPFPSGSFDIEINNATMTVEMFSTSTVSYFLPQNVIAPIRAILVAIIYIMTLISIYTIVRHSHLL